jgi:hypothetical protein
MRASQSATSANQFTRSSRQGVDIVALEGASPVSIS